MIYPETLPLTPALRHIVEHAIHTLGRPCIQLASSTDLDTSELWSDELLDIASYLFRCGDELHAASDRLRHIVAARRYNESLIGLPTQDGDTIYVRIAGGVA